jgi:hypothetical protein
MKQSTWRKPQTMLIVITIVALLGAVAGTLIGGQVCIFPDETGCGHQPNASDGDWYGLPIPWRTNASTADLDSESEEAQALKELGMFGHVSVTLLTVDAVFWFVGTFALQWSGLELYYWRRRKQWRLTASSPPARPDSSME